MVTLGFSAILALDVPDDDPQALNSAQSTIEAVTPRSLFMCLELRQASP
jgi:hypothetical protein